VNDTPTGYGWISIGLHWLTAVLIVYLLYLGSSIGGLEGDARTAAVRRHTSVALASYLILIGRIVWRLYCGHPGPTAEQRGWAHTLGKYTHYAMLVALAVQILTGPLMQWSYGRDIEVFDWFVIPSPMEAAFGFASMLHSLHAASALFLFFAILLHIGGVYKHTAFNQDGTLAKMIVPGRQSAASSAAPSRAKNEGES
jgi:cytochrome b561